MTDRKMDKYVTCGALGLILLTVLGMPISYATNSAIPLLVICGLVVAWGIPIIVHMWRAP